MEQVLELPAFIKWRHEALQEPWHVAHYEEGHTPVSVFHKPKT